MGRVVDSHLFIFLYEKEGSPAVPIWEDSTRLLGITPQAKGWNPLKLGRPGMLPFPMGK